MTVDIKHRIERYCSSYFPIGTPNGTYTHHDPLESFAAATRTSCLTKTAGIVK